MPLHKKIAIPVEVILEDMRGGRIGCGVGIDDDVGETVLAEIDEGGGDGCMDGGQVCGGQEPQGALRGILGGDDVVEEERQDTSGGQVRGG